MGEPRMSFCNTRPTRLFCARFSYLPLQPVLRRIHYESYMDQDQPPRNEKGSIISASFDTKQGTALHEPASCGQICNGDNFCPTKAIERVRYGYSSDHYVFRREGPFLMSPGPHMNQYDSLACIEPPKHMLYLEASLCRQSSHVISCKRAVASH